MDVISRVAGTGVAGSGGDGGPAVDARLSNTGAVAVAADGGFLIADSGNSVIRRVSATGVITTAAGTGVVGSAGDDGQASAAQLVSPAGVTATSDGGFLIADYAAVRKVSPAGGAVNVITRIAGITGVQGSSGDDGPAIDAKLADPWAVAVTADGGFLIADLGNHVVRKVSSAGIISRVAGTTGVSGSSGDRASA